MKIALITAGGAGMFCGSCMQDNTLVRALRMAGADAVLIPTYTPITVDEDNVSLDRVFLGGINVYLDSVIPGWRYLPRFLTHQLDRPGIVRFLSRFSGSTDAAKLGPLTLDMLAGATGPQRREIEELRDAIVDDIRPEVVILSNALLSGIVPALRSRFDGPIHVILQGDDIFLDALPPRYRSQAIDQIHANCENADLFLTHSRYYAQFMASRLSLPESRFRQIPLSLDVSGHTNVLETPQRSDDDFTIGYFARICPEKGIHHLLDAAQAVLPQFPGTRLVVAGYCPAQHREWFTTRLENAQRHIGSSRIDWLGSPADRDEKLKIMERMDVLCVPTDYHEPKGLFVLEAAFSGVSSILPAHGAFPERLETLQFGSLYDPADPGALIAALQDVICNRDTLWENRSLLRTNVSLHHGMEATGRCVLDVLQAQDAQRDPGRTN